MTRISRPRIRKEDVVGMIDEFEAAIPAAKLRSEIGMSAG